MECEKHEEKKWKLSQQKYSFSEIIDIFAVIWNDQTSNFNKRKYNF